MLDDDVRQEVSARLKTLRTKNEQLEAERDNSRRAFEDVAAISVAAAAHITQGQGAQQAQEQHASHLCLHRVSAACQANLWPPSRSSAITARRTAHWVLSAWS